jgi:hypothetical protein
MTITDTHKIYQILISGYIETLLPENIDIAVLGAILL